MKELTEVMNLIANIGMATFLISINICLCWAMIIGYKEQKAKEKARKLKQLKERRLRRSE
ncbi:hypothetical protein [Ligilactobacillus ceti]|nr:hypothetical protein [Ligilactobacillus ceti]